MSSTRPLIALIVAAVSWGLGAVITKHAVADIPPLLLLPIQLAASLAVLAVALRLTHHRVSRAEATSPLATLGVVNPGLAYLLSLLGLAEISVSLSVILWTAEPLLIIGLAAILLRERLPPAGIALSAGAAAGMALVLLEPGTTGSALGIGLVLAGVACCAAYTIAARHLLAADDAALPIVAAQQAWALVFAVVVAVIALIAGGIALPARLEPAGLLAALGSGVIYYGVAFVAYVTALRHLSAPVAASSFYLVPIVGLAGGALALGDALSPLQWLGAILVVGAVAALLRPTGTPASPPVVAGGTESRA